MLTGRLPFEGDTPMGVAIQHINAIPVPPRSLNPDVPEMLETITMKAMAPSLDQRYETADEMLEDLKDFRKNPDMEVIRPGPVDEPTTVVVPVSVDVVENIERRPKAQPEPEYRERRRQEIREDEDDYDERPRRGGGVIAAVSAIVLILAFIGVMIFFLYDFFIKGMFEETPEYKVPTVLGRTVEDLKNNPSILGEFKLKEDGVVYSEEYKEGQICEQTPEAGSMVREGELVITVKISGGEGRSYMPDVEGWDVRRAVQLLQNEMGLVVDIVEEFSNTITKDLVIDYRPIKDLMVEKGSRVTLWVSKGPENPKVPMVPVVGRSLETAEQMITDLGLEVGEVKHYPDDTPAGTVIWQSVDALVEVEKGSFIDLWVSLGPPETEPPETEPPETEPPVTETPGIDPPATEDPLPVETGVVSTDTTKPIVVDLSDYEGTISLRIVVGGETLLDIAVDADANESKIVYATASGSQLVQIYIDDDMVEQYYIDFSQ